jgi:hypothetical protein
MRSKTEHLKAFMDFPRSGTNPPPFFPSTESALWYPARTAYTLARDYYTQQYGLVFPQNHERAMDDAGLHVRRDPRQRARDVWSIPETIAMRKLAAEGRVGDVIELRTVHHPSALNLQRRALADAFGAFFKVQQIGTTRFDGMAVMLTAKGDTKRPLNAVKPRRKPRPTRIQMSAEDWAEHQTKEAARKAGIGDLL